MDTLTDESVEVRRAAILSLGVLGSGVGAVERVLAQLQADPDASIKANVKIAKALIGPTDESDILILIEALGSKETSATDSAIKALKRFGKRAPEKLIPALVEAVKSNEQPVGKNALKVLAAMKDAGQTALPSIVAAYDNFDPKNRFLVLRTAIEIDVTGDHAIPLCMKALEDPEVMTRQEALKGALRHKTKLEGHFAPLVKSLKDTDEENKLLAIAMIKGIDNRAAEAVPSLIDLTKESNQTVRISAISALGSLNPPTKEAVAAVGAAIKDKDEKVRTTALSVLRNAGRRAPEMVIPVLEEALQTEHGQKTKRSIMAVLDGLKRQSGERK